MHTDREQAPVHIRALYMGFIWALYGEMTAPRSMSNGACPSHTASLPGARRLVTGFLTEIALPTPAMKLPPILSTVTSTAFHRLHFTPQTPCRTPPGHFTPRLPAISTWFSECSINVPFFQSMLSSLEISTVVTVESSTPNGFDRITIPFFLLLQYLAHRTPPPELPNLYLAQAPLLDMIPTLRSSLPTPELVSKTGKGDIYATNVWLGRSETINTPLHKDPNPNLFVQIAGRKRIRLFSPEEGRKVVGEVRMFRQAEEMMMGEQAKRVEERVWGQEHEDGFEVEVAPGDGIFIPMGWWHAVKGVGEGVGGSVNWWFR
jgi:hypothetical protein